jgi:allophanate hydrolase subunit 2
MFKGITKQFVINKNDLLPITGTSKILIKKNASLKIGQKYFNSEQLEVFEGPEFRKLSKSQQELLLSKTFMVSKDNNRMAYQFEETLENDLDSIVTSAVLPGTVQLTPSGKLIVLMRDCQTTGGYPRVLQLKESAIDVLSQKFTGQSIFLNLI